MAEQIFLQVSLIIISAVAISFIARFFKQPLLIGYILTGIILGSFLNTTSIALDSLRTFAELGVTLLLFIVGMNLNPRIIREIGKSSLLIGLGQIIITSVLGFFILKLIGFGYMPSLYIAIAITFSSTIIVTKLLSDAGDLETLYGKISIGLLIFQDIIAIIILMFASSSANNIFPTIFKGLLAIALLFFLSFWIFPKLLPKIAKSQEILFLFSISWFFLVSSLFYYLNFSIEIGALLAGMALAASPYAFDISAKIKPLKEFFLILFFIMLGMQMRPAEISMALYPSIILSLFILIGKPAILMGISGILGYTKKTSFLTGLTATQISEFSIIMVAVGINAGYLTRDTISIITLTGIITITLSSYLIIYSKKLYAALSQYIPIIDKNPKKEALVKENYDAILFGYNRIGFSILKSLNKVTKNYTVIDFNPETIKLLRKRNISSIYADAENSSLLDELNLKKIKLAISTIPSIETNLLLIEKIRIRNKKAVIIVIAHQINDALQLYKKGADYVILPHFLGGDYASKLIESLGFKKERYRENKEGHLSYLKERIREGHEHPKRR